MVQRLLALLSIVALTAACDTRPGGSIGVQPPASKLGFVTQPANTQAANPIPGVQIAVQTPDGSTRASSNAVITLSITVGTGPAGAVLSGGSAQAAAGGVVTFSNLRIDLPGGGYTLTATSGGLTTAISGPFTITP